MKNDFHNYNENLFFKIIKNKYLFNKILNFISIINNNNNNIISFKYDQLINVNYILKNKWYKLLELKIKTGDYLIFNNNTSNENSNNTYFSPIFKIVNKNNNNLESSIDFKSFYKSLFKNYKIYLINKFQLILNSIELNNFEAFKQLIKLKNVKEDQQKQEENEIILKKSIENSNFKILKYLINKRIIINFNEIGNIQTLWNYLLSFNSYESIKNRYKIINFIISNNIIISTSISNSIKSIFSICPFQNEFTIKNLIDSCYSINLINQFDQQQNQSPLNNNLTNTELYNIKNQYKSLNQLKLNIKYINCNSDNSNQHQHLKSLLNMYFSVNNNQFSLCYLLSTNQNNQLLLNFEINENSCNSIGINAIMYGNWLILNKFLKIKSNNGLLNFQNEILNEIYIKSKYPNLLFKYCSSSTNTISEFIYSFCNELNEINNNNSNYSIISLLFNLIIEYDNLNLIQIVLNKLSSKSKSKSSLFKFIESNSINLYRFIKSIDSLKFINDNLNLDNKYHFSCYKILWELGRIDLLNYYENNILPIDEIIEFSYKTIYPTLLPNDIIKDSIIKVSKYIIEQQEVQQSFKYTYDKIVTECWLDSKQFKNYLIDLNDVKFIIQNTPNHIPYHHLNALQILSSPSSSFSNSLLFLKLFNWCLINRPNDLLIIKCNSKNQLLAHSKKMNKRSIISISNYNELLYLTNRLCKIISGDSIGSISNSSISNSNFTQSIWKGIGKFGDIKNLKILLKFNYDNNNNGDDYFNNIFECLKSASEFGQISIFDCFSSSSSFSPSSPSSSSYTSSFSLISPTVISFIMNNNDYLYTLFKIIIENDHFELFEFFLNCNLNSNHNDNNYSIKELGLNYLKKLELRGEINFNSMIYYYYFIINR